MAVGPFMNFATSLHTALLADATGGQRGRFFRLIPVSAHDAFTEGWPSQDLRGTIMALAKLRVLQGGKEPGAWEQGAWARTKGAGNATLDAKYCSVTIIDLVLPEVADSFVCVVERTAEGEHQQLFRLETSSDVSYWRGGGGNFCYIQVHL